MGQDVSRPGGSRHRDKADDAAAAAGGPSLWDGVPSQVLWLIQSQVRLLLTHHASALLHRPDALSVPDDDDDDYDADDSSMTSPRRVVLQPHEHAIAHAALRDRIIGARLQRALDRLVPAQLTEADFWDNFFSHVDVIKVRLVTDFLTAQDAAATERTTKHEGWVQLFEAMDPEMRSDVRQAAERIAVRQQQPPPSAVELALGLDAARPPRWSPDGETWLKYVRDGPHDVEKVLRKALGPEAEPPAAAPAALLAYEPSQGAADVLPYAPAAAAKPSRAQKRKPQPPKEVSLGQQLIDLSEIM
jgi:hypothetical protein